MKKKILIYNWIPFDEKEGKGGGVTIYTKNLIEYLMRDDLNELYFLCSGRAYDRLRNDTYIEKIPNIYDERCSCYQIVNSPVLSSGHLSFPYPEDMQCDRTLKEIVKEFLMEIGGVDVIHFQNLEGLSLSVLELKEEFPNTRFIYSIHNYYAFCPQVMLWQKNEKACEEDNCGKCCIECLPMDVFKEKVIFNQQLVYDQAHGRKISHETIRKKTEMEAHYAIKTTNRKFSDDELSRLEALYSNYRKKNVKYLNLYMDEILAVSKRVESLALKCGVSNEKIRVSYIGTKLAERQKMQPNHFYKVEENFVVCYLGYMRHNKGFFFFLDALEQIPNTLAQKMEVVFATEITDKSVEERMQKLKQKYAKIHNYGGYTHEDLECILKEVHLGIVCPLWEDNLPQIGIELKAHGVPVLCSDKGGTSELSAAKEFVFEAGKIDDFINKLSRIAKGEVALDTYYEQGMRLITMDEHVRELQSIYKHTR